MSAGLLWLAKATGGGTMQIYHGWAIIAVGIVASCTIGVGTMMPLSVFLQLLSAAGR